MENNQVDNIGEVNKVYSEDECKQIAWKAYMSRTDEREFFLIHRKEAREEFEKWWKLNCKDER